MDHTRLKGIFTWVLKISNNFIHFWNGELNVKNNIFSQRKKIVFLFFIGQNKDRVKKIHWEQMWEKLPKASHLQSLWKFVYLIILTHSLQIWSWKLAQMTCSMSETRKKLIFHAKPGQDKPKPKLAKLKWTKNSQLQNQNQNQNSKANPKCTNKPKTWKHTCGLKCSVSPRNAGCPAWSCWNSFPPPPSKWDFSSWWSYTWAFVVLFQTL